MSVAKERQKFDPTMQGCNAWVFCTNPNGCANGEKTMPGLSCTLKRIPLDNPDIQKRMRARSSRDEQVETEPPAGLVAGGSGDFVSGLCNIPTPRPSDFPCNSMLQDVGDGMAGVRATKAASDNQLGN